jgi:hypothetical protein
VAGEVMTTSVNNYPAEVYGEGEIVIQTNPMQLEATDGRVFLTRLELLRLLDMIDTDLENKSPVE